VEIVPAAPPARLPLKININTASFEQLLSIGLQESVVKNIIRYRKYKANFKNIEELKKVPGVSKKFFESIKDKITVE